MSKKIFCLLIALLMVLTVSCVSAAEDTNDTVVAVDEQVAVQKTIDDVPLESNDNDSDVLSAGTVDPNFNMKPNCNDYGDVSFSASTEKDATGTVHVKFILKSPGGDTVQADETLELVNGSVKWGGPGNYLPKGSYTVWAQYSGDNKYASATLQTPDVGPDAFNVPKYPISLNFTSIAVNEKGNIVVNGQLDNTKADGPYVLTFTNKDNGKNAIWYRQQVQSGGIIVNEKTPELGAGEYIVSISYVGTDQYFPASPQEKNINISAISITNEKIELSVGDEIESGASLIPAGAGNLTFVSGNESVVTVDAKTGVITAVGLGNATVTVSCAGNDKYGPAVNKTITVTAVAPKTPTNISVNPAELTLLVNQVSFVNATLTPADAGALNYTSSNPSVVTVDKNGNVTAVGAGEANITVSFAGNDEYAAAKTTVTVTVSLNPASVSVNNSTLDLKIDDTFTIVPTTSPEGLNVTYVPDNSGVVSVDENGNVTALKEGNATIVVKIAPNGVYAENSTTVSVSVSKIPTEIKIDGSTGEMSVDAMVPVSAKLDPSEAGNLTYVSNDTDVATVSPTGIIKANKAGTALITVSFAGNDKYAAAENKTVTITVNLKPASVSVNKSTLDLKVDDTFTIVPTTSPEGLNVTYVPDNSGVVSVDENGKVTALKTGKAVITVKIAPNGVYAENSTKVTVNVKGIPTEITASAVTTVYNVDKDLVITLKDVNGTPLSGFDLTVDLNGKKTYTTDAKGQVTVSTKGLAPKAYTAKITFNGNSKYAKSTKDVKVTVKKATPKITAKAKTFKTTTKTKKYAITLKNNVNKAISKATVYLKVGGKTYKATTNSKGKATFKITKLSKAGTFKATITYKGNTYYNKATKKATIKVKSVWKTVSRGSKAITTVKKIQKALKKNGYYLEYNGHYLKVDGIYQQYTEMAVKQFQKDKGLKVTGKVDEKTAKKLGII